MFDLQEKLIRRGQLYGIRTCSPLVYSAPSIRGISIEKIVNGNNKAIFQFNNNATSETS